MLCAWAHAWERGLHSAWGWLAALPGPHAEGRLCTSGHAAPPAPTQTRAAVPPARPAPADRAKHEVPRAGAHRLRVAPAGDLQGGRSLVWEHILLPGGVIGWLGGCEWHLPEASRASVTTLLRDGRGQARGVQAGMPACLRLPAGPGAWGLGWAAGLAGGVCCAVAPGQLEGHAAGAHCKRAPRCPAARHPTHCMLRWSAPQVATCSWDGLIKFWD